MPLHEAACGRKSEVVGCHSQTQQACGRMDSRRTPWFYGGREQEAGLPQALELDTGCPAATQQESSAAIALEKPCGLAVSDPEK